MQQSVSALEHETRSNGIQSVRRAAALLREFGGGAVELGVSELGRRLDLHKSTVSRLLATLESEGLLEHAPGSDKYRLGKEMRRLALNLALGGDVRTVARPFLVELAEATHETTNLAVLENDEVHTVDQVSGPHLVRIGNWVGRRTPLHCAANGKALLAFQPSAEVERLTAGPLRGYTTQTVVAGAALRDALARVREQGYAVALGEMEEGLNSVAAPIFGAGGQVLAALSVSGPAYRLTPERVPEFAALTVEAGRKVSRLVGWAGA